jgi:signal peptidase I
VISLIVVAIAVAAVNWLVATAVYVPTIAMRPTYTVGTRLILDKVGFRITGLHSGDVVSVRLPKRDRVDSFDLLKRIVGLPGDRMGCDLFGRITRNGTVVPYGFMPPNEPAGLQCPEVTVPVGDIYIIGDNLDDSYDSRIFGPIPESSVRGRVAFKL